MATNVLLTGNGSNIFPIIKNQEQIYHDGEELSSAIKTLKTEIFSSFYPEGAILILENKINPNDFISGIYWEACGAGKILVGEGYLNNDSSSTYINENSSNAPTGEYTVALTTSTMPAHSHSLYLVPRASGTQGSDARNSGSAYYTTYAGGGGSHNNIMPYKVVNFWKRVPAQKQGANLNDFSWGQIKQIIKEGKAQDYWAVGDIKIAYTTNGDPLMFQIVDFREEEINEDGTGAQGIVFEAVQTIKPNISCDQAYKPWKSSTLAIYFDEIFSKILPLDLISEITPVYKNHLYFNNLISPTASTLEKEQMTFWIASAKERGATTSEYITTDDKVFAYYNGLAATHANRGKEYLWDNVASYDELLRSAWYDPDVIAIVFSDCTTHTFSDDGSVSGTLLTQRGTGAVDSNSNTFHFAPCFFIGGV